MLDSSDLPEDPEEVWASVHVNVDRENPDTHKHSDGSEHTVFACTLRIENHGLPGDKFIEALIMACVQVVAAQMDETEVFTDKVPPEVRAHMTMVMAKEWLKQKVSSGDYPDSMIAFAIPTHIDFE